MAENSVGGGRVAPPGGKVLGVGFGGERTVGTVFGSVAAILNIIALLGVVIAVRGCDTCVARFLGKTL